MVSTVYCIKSIKYYGRVENTTGWQYPQRVCIVWKIWNMIGLQSQKSPLKEPRTLLATAAFCNSTQRDMQGGTGEEAEFQKSREEK